MDDYYNQSIVIVSLIQKRISSFFDLTNWTVESKMDVKVVYFGMIAERIGKQEEIIDIDPSESVSAFFRNKYPELMNMSFQVAINQEIKDSIENIEEVKEIALLPPFAGG